jgi:hypothetical protein
MSCDLEQASGGLGDKSHTADIWTETSMLNHGDAV